MEAHSRWGEKKKTGTASLSLTRTSNISAVAQTGNNALNTQQFLLICFIPVPAGVGLNILAPSLQRDVDRTQI